MTPMDRERQERLLVLLTEEKRRLWNELREDLFQKLGQDLHTQYDIPQDIAELGVIDQLADTGLAVADIRREELTRIEDALNRLKEGSYGVCADCSQLIDEARLRVSPCAPCCIRCQERREGPAAAAGLTL